MPGERLTDAEIVSIRNTVNVGTIAGLFQRALDELQALRERTLQHG